MTNISKEHIRRIDTLYFDPKERATGVNSIIFEALDELEKEVGATELPTHWDLLCWAVEYIAQQSVAIGDESFTELAVGLTRWLYQSHYTTPQSIYGDPDKGEKDAEEDDSKVGGSDSSSASK